MSIAQRGTSTSGVTTADGYYACDRFYTRTDTGTWTISQSTDVPSGQGFTNSFKLDCTSAGTSNGDEVLIRYNIEGQNVQYLKYGTSNAESLTLSFWVKSNKTGTYSVNINNFNDTQSRIFSFDYTIDSANTWEKKTKTLPGDTSYTPRNDNTTGFQIQFMFSADLSIYGGGTSNAWVNYVSDVWASPNLAGLGGSADDEVYLTGVQLEAGTTASDFEFLPTAINKTLCERYFQRITGFGAGGAGTTNIQASVSFRTDMRASPSIGVLTTTGNGHLKFTDGASNLDPSSFTYTNQSTRTDGFFGIFGNYSGVTTGRQYRRAIDDGDFVKLDAEL
jgi:hypothetical protein